MPAMLLSRVLALYESELEHRIGEAWDVERLNVFKMLLTTFIRLKNCWQRKEYQGAAAS